jgi:hypothetical protein
MRKGAAADYAPGESPAHPELLRCLKTPVAWWAPPEIDTGATRRDDPAAAGVFHHKPLAEGIFRRDHFPTLGVRTGSGECHIFVWACHGLFSAR